jgi:general secretion pathway protein K
MTIRRRSAPLFRHSNGFALIIVLWTLVLIAFIVAHLTASGRTEIRIAGNLVADAAAEAADDGAISAAIFNQLDPNPDQRWQPNGPPHEVVIGDSRVMVRLEDEAGRVNPNSSSPALLEALLRAIGSDPDSARRLAAAIGDWVGTAQAARPQEAVLADYRAAGRDYGPPGAPLETLDELGRVLGVTPAVLSAIRPHLTLFGPAEPNPVSADPIVAAALAEISQPRQTVPLGNQAQLEPVTTRITALAFGPSNARVTRSAIVRFWAPQPPGYTVLARGSNLD